MQAFARWAALTCLAAGVCAADSNPLKGDYAFDGTISRPVLENYLSRAITFYFLLDGWGDLDDNVRMLGHVGAKFVGRGVFLWGEETRIETLLAAAVPALERVHEMDSEIIVQTGIFEIITEDVDNVPAPAWIFEEFGLAPETRNFRYESMVYPDGYFEDYWGPGASIPDMSQLETRMWFVYLARRYLDAGYEAIHFGVVDCMTANDPGFLYWSDMLTHVRAYANAHARRHLVLCDAHLSSGGVLEDGRLLFDFHSFPIRIEEVPGEPERGMLVMGYLDSIYGRSPGGITPSGWSCDHLPYLVELDNWGASGQEGEDIGGYWIWGYDEICWFANQEESYRNQWLHYAWHWVRENDPNGFFQMPGSRVLAAPAGGVEWYWANTASAATPDGFNQEETIRAIWQFGPDTDHDGLPDWWEIHYFGDLLQAGSDDPDGDGLVNSAEYTLGTDPVVDDADTVPAASSSCVLFSAVVVGLLGVGRIRSRRRPARPVRQT